LASTNETEKLLSPKRRSKGAERQKEEGGISAKDVAMFGAEMIPGVGEAMAVKRTSDALDKKDYLGAGIEATAGLLGIIPGVGDVAGKALRTTRKLKEADALEIGINPATKDGALLKGYDTATSKNISKNSSAATAGTKEANKLINAKVADGTKVGIRLNLNSTIPNMPKGLDKLQTLHKNNYNGKALSYKPFATVEDVTFNVSQKGRQGIAAKIKSIDVPEAKSKFPAMSVDGKYNNTRNVLDEIDDDVVEIGFNPVSGHLFIDLSTGQAVKSADVATVIGDRVYAKGVTYMKKAEAPNPLSASDGTPLPSEVRYKMKKGGVVPMDRQMSMFEDGGLMDEGGTIDPVSGNDVPPGSTQEEVRDDIPAQLSEGEFVFPADVVRYIGLGNLMRMRQEAKMGLKLMEQMGQMGNSEEATMPDNLPFDINDLDMEDEIDDNSSQEFAQGGVVYAQDGALIPSAYGTQTAQQPYQGYNPYQAAAATAADPIEAASAQYQAPQQSYTPTSIYKQEDIPTFKEFVGENIPNVDFELVEYRNAEGNSIMIKISKATGQPVQGEVIPEGYTKYDPEKTKTEDVMTGAVTPETTMVMDSGKMSKEEKDAQRKADAEKAIRVKDRIAAAKELGYTEFTSPFSGVGGMLASLVIPGGAMLAGAKGVGAKGQKGMLTGMGYVLDGEGGMFDPTTGHKVPTGLISALRDDFTYRGLSDFAKNQLKTDAALKEDFGAELYNKMVDNAIDKKFDKYEEDNVSMGDSNYIKEVKEAVKDEAKKGNVNTKGKIINPFEAQQGLGQYDPSKDLKVQRDAEAAAAKAAAERAKYRPASGGGGPAAGGGFGGYAPGGGGGGGSAATGGGGGAPSGPGSSDVGGQNRGYRAKGGLMEKEKPKTKKMKKGGLASKK
jgi:hypothetical protein